MKYLKYLALFALSLSLWPQTSFAATGIFGSGGGTFTTGQQFTITITASGDSFDAVQGSISVSGPVSVVSVAAGSATWLPGKSPTASGQFIGITSATSSMTVAKLTLKGTSAGSGAVSVSGVKLARSGTVVGTSGGTTSFTIQRQLVPPSAVSVTSSTHADQGTAYEATSVALAWNKASGVTGFSYVYDDVEGTTPAAKSNTTDTSITYDNQTIGTHYFHIRAQNADGWGGTTTFKITIKEPDPKVDESLAKPTLTTIQKQKTYTTDLKAGTMSGITLKGTGTIGFTNKFSVTPGIELTKDEVWQVATPAEGTWELKLISPIKSGFYTLTIQGIKDKTLTPVSETYTFEVSVAQQGRVQIITDDDAVTLTADTTPTPTPTKKTFFSSLSRGDLIKIGAAALAVLLLALLTVYFIRRRHRNIG